MAFDNYYNREHMTPRQVADTFTSVASLYDQMWTIQNYRDPIHVAEVVANSFQEDERASVRILDVASGSGMLAEQLWKKGFRQLDGLDPSPGMMAEAMKKGVYTNYYLESMDVYITTMPPWLSYMFAPLAIYCCFCHIKG